jgi:hypothetical protein
MSKRKVKPPNCNWEILVKHPMWKGWRSQVDVYNRSEIQAIDEARHALLYYEGATETKVVPMRKDKNPCS